VVLQDLEAAAFLPAHLAEAEAAVELLLEAVHVHLLVAADQVEVTNLFKQKHCYENDFKA
jgi:hypothetical protein